ncbi:apolipoprotein N-acyltransferase [Maritimibacter sp. DP1N21-5]|uniref:apolipoprotein N-acyltransferase n=1 Tax=Maritimibacter sp. DP1N21-5 TaxID=2836867 RepID=UPI001C43AA5D|nr:apolipoprotein N-acyltransferase [Maritimibacter sp. DP1N21-5]MBV7408629.1 apolipoprotein N-acyltransferase [Maritimibacter sp. DP1N21-5]
MPTDVVGRPGMRDSLAWVHARWPRVFAVALSGGIVAGLGQRPVDLWPFTFVGLAVGAALVAAAPTWKRAALSGWALGTGYFGLTFAWVVNPFLVEPEVYGWMAPFGVFFLAAGMALYWGLAAGIVQALRPGRWLWLAMAAAFAFAEVLRGWLFTGFPWGGPGMIWIDLPMAQYARFGGVYGLNAVSFALGFGIWQAIEGLQGRIVWVGAVFLFALGGFFLQRPAPAPMEATVRLVQPNAPQELKWHPDWVETFYDRSKELSAGEGSPDLVIWPETTIPALLGQSPWFEAEAAASAAPAPLIAGIQRRDGASYYNSLVLYRGDEVPLWVYDKHHLVPFGEFVPFGNLMAKVGIHGLAQREGMGFSSGVGAEVLPLPDGLGNVLPLICYEMIFPRDIRSAPVRPDWIVQSTNDAWFGTFSGPQQHLVQARFRAIEFGLPVARAANTGISAVIDATGAVTASLGLGQAGVIDAPIPVALPETPYAKWADWPLILGAIATLFILGLRRRRYAIDPDSSLR